MTAQTVFRPKVESCLEIITIVMIPRSQWPQQLGTLPASSTVGLESPKKSVSAAELHMISLPASRKGMVQLTIVTNRVDQKRHAAFPDSLCCMAYNCGLPECCQCRLNKVLASLNSFCFQIFPSANARLSVYIIFQRLMSASTSAADVVAVLCVCDAA